ncbi:hypothetical protein [Thalassospira xiamenensis]|uniref:hypothetical protein n=1 Tax=Thalassospira xiamenensis TaxID=220697 RepID=UPI000DEDCB5B|nr:hypothetical protein [Thalassospira xiamenensis]RCK37228.1 hypothetical protein TH24_16760 [Thalassospira xiamenensis]
MNDNHLTENSLSDLDESLYRVTQILCPGKADLLPAGQSKLEPGAETVECVVIPFPERFGFF